MRLPRPFYRFPLLVDAERLRAEVSALPAAAWVAHPNQLPGNSAVRLISAAGAETDAVQGRMQPTPWLRTCPYIRQVLAAFGVVWSRSRLMRLAPGAEVPQHADINYHWHTRVRVHIPVITRPQVRFHCGEEVVHMAAGEAWIFDNWRLHRVENPTAEERIHLVADTTGTAAFWRLAGQELPPERWHRIAWQPGFEPQLLTETNERGAVMPAAEVQLLLNDLRAELTSADGTDLRGDLAQFHAQLEAFLRDWRQLCALHGTNGTGMDEFRRLAGALRDGTQRTGSALMVRTNRMSALRVLEARVLQHLVADDGQPARVETQPALRRPVFIVAAPRSGSTLLFETLACSPAFHTFGGEAHWLIEGQPSLQPGAPGVESNRLLAAHATPAVIAAIRQSIAGRLQGPGGQTPAAAARLLEKTPKNSLRVPFLHAVFPDAQFIFLWRDPRENVGSIMEAWRAGRWITYPTLPEWDGPWSMLLPPQWRELRGAPLATVAARQWLAANDIALGDLQQLPAGSWMPVAFHDFLADPAATVRRLCAFLEVEFDAALQARTASALPPSRYTLTPPAADKWRSNAAAIESVLSDLTDCWQRLRSLADQSSKQ